VLTLTLRLAENRALLVARHEGGPLLVGEGALLGGDLAPRRRDFRDQRAHTRPRLLERVRGDN